MKPGKTRIERIEKAAYGVAEFCEAHGISRATFYNLMKDGKAPRTMKAGGRVLISLEAARDWRSSLEADTAATRRCA